ncbi:MAG: heavy-metal-associated domain-containing protein, partial [Nitrospiraceae bacterium]
MSKAKEGRKSNVPEVKKPAEQEGKRANEPLRIDLPVTGMTCAACSARVQKSLAGMKGVENASVNLPAERATVVYNPAEASVDEFIREIQGLGYGV